MKNVTELTADSEMQCDSEKSTSSESARPTVVYQLIIEDVHSWVRLSHFTPATNTFPGNCLSSDQRARQGTRAALGCWETSPYSFNTLRPADWS